jgi:hypothetical protein
MSKITRVETKSKKCIHAYLEEEITVFVKEAIDAVRDGTGIMAQAERIPSHGAVGEELALVATLVVGVVHYGRCVVECRQKHLVGNLLLLVLGVDFFNIISKISS